MVLTSAQPCTMGQHGPLTQPSEPQLGRSHRSRGVFLGRCGSAPAGGVLCKQQGPVLTSPFLGIFKFEIQGLTLTGCPWTPGSQSQPCNVHGGAEGPHVRPAPQPEGSRTAGVRRTKARSGMPVKPNLPLPPASPSLPGHQRRHSPPLPLPSFLVTTPHPVKQEWLELGIWLLAGPPGRDH